VIGDERGDALREAHGDLNPLSLQLWKGLCSRSEWDVIIDVGANYGEMLLGIDLPSHANVIAFEPSVAVSDCLRASVRDTDLAIRVETLAVGAASESTTLYVDNRWSGTTTTLAARATDPRQRVTVNAVRLDEYLREHGVSAAGSVLIKIDVEGDERKVLDGIESLRRGARELVIHAEIFHLPDDDLQWMLARYAFHLVDKNSDTLVLVESIERLRELLGTDRYYGQDAVLSTEPMDNASHASEAPVSMWRSYVSTLRAHSGLKQLRHLINPTEILEVAREHVAHTCESTWSWRLTRPLRAVARMGQSVRRRHQ
jgi:FkbM family methyltransferase